MNLTEQAIHFLEEGYLLEPTEELIDEIDLQEQINEAELDDSVPIGSLD